MREQPTHRKRHNPPRRDTRGSEQRGQCECQRHADRGAPIVDDDELPYCEQESTHSCHVFTAGCAVRLEGLAITMATTRMPGMIASSAASPPGQLAPAPSARQNMPNELSITPTANFSVFSGTRASGALAAAPTAMTSSTASPAAAAARATWCWLAPKVSTINATSRPSKSTPLKAI